MIFNLPPLVEAHALRNCSVVFVSVFNVLLACSKVRAHKAEVGVVKVKPNSDTSFVSCHP